MLSLGQTSRLLSDRAGSQHAWRLCLTHIKQIKYFFFPVKNYDLFL